MARREIRLLGHHCFHHPTHHRLQVLSTRGQTPLHLLSNMDQQPLLTFDPTSRLPSSPVDSNNAERLAVIQPSVHTRPNPTRKSERNFECGRAQAYTNDRDALYWFYEP